MNKLNSYVKQTLAMLDGNTDEVTAQKNYRLASSALKMQISALEGKQVKAETDVEAAEDNLKSAKFPTEIISDTEAYIKNIKRSQDKLDELKEDLENIKESITYFVNLQKEYNKEVTE